MRNRRAQISIAADPGPNAQSVGMIDDAVDRGRSSRRGHLLLEFSTESTDGKASAGVSDMASVTTTVARKVIKKPRRKIVCPPASDTDVVSDLLWIDASGEPTS